MDNQNANNGGLPQNQNIPQGSTPPQDNNQTADQQNPPAATFENLRTQSVIESSRDVAEKELAAQEAYNNELIRQQQAEIRRNKGKHIAVKIALIFFGILLAAALIWLIVVIIINLSQGIKPDDCVKEDGTIETSCCGRSEYKDRPSCKQSTDPLPTIDGYRCKNNDCKKMADIIKDEKTIIFDRRFYIYNIKENTTSPLAIDNSIKYNSMSVFEWGKGNYYVILKPATEDFGLFSITHNQQIIGNKVSRIYSDINHKAYKGMTDVLGRYIIVRESGHYRLYDAKTGDELASGSDGVFSYKNYIMTYHSDGTRRLHNLSKKEIVLVKSDEEVYMRSGYAIVSGKNIVVYDNSGVKQNTKNSIVKDINSKKRNQRSQYLQNQKLFYHMPTSRDYSE